jgi:peptidoglycan/LPS O-acetylase OafA/YrhL
MTLQGTDDRETTASLPPRAEGEITRLSALDGLRGVAAVVVVFHHLLLMAEPELRNLGGSGVGSVFWWISQTPLKLLTAGSEAVLVFFVLSGLVVALPAVKSSKFRFTGFLTGRLVRLYVPVWVSLAIGTALVWFIPRRPSAISPGTWMDASQATTMNWGKLFSQASLTPVSYDVNNVLWSLRWELVFSVLLPLFVALAIVVGRHWGIALGVAWMISTVGMVTGIDAFRYLPVFFIGTLFAVRLNEIREWSRRRMLRAHAHAKGLALVSGSLLLLIAYWLFGTSLPSGSVGSAVLSQLSVLGAAGLILSAIGVPVLRDVLESRTVQWFGRISFSLYLVHVPIIASLTFAIGEQKWWLVALIALPTVILVAWGFHRGIERPSQILARRVAGHVTTRADAHRERASAAG